MATPFEEKQAEKLWLKAFGPKNAKEEKKARKILKRGEGKWGGKK